jgi:hypothetical protein
MIVVDLFKPSDGNISLKDEYPELTDIGEFRDLSDDELIFCYNMGCPTSKLFGTKNEKAKIQSALTYSFGKNISDAERTKFLNNNYPEKLRVAIARFKQFRPSARMRAKIMVDKVFDNFESIVNPGEQYMTAMKNDVDLQSKYVTNSIKVVEALKDLIKTKEAGFGVTISGNVSEQDSKDGEPTLLDRAVQ